MSKCRNPEMPQLDSFGQELKQANYHRTVLREGQLKVNDRQQDQRFSKVSQHKLVLWAGFLSTGESLVGIVNLKSVSPFRSRGPIVLNVRAKESYWNLIKGSSPSQDVSMQPKGSAPSLEWMNSRSPSPLAILRQTIRKKTIFTDWRGHISQLMSIKQTTSNDCGQQKSRGLRRRLECCSTTGQVGWN